MTVKKLLPTSCPKKRRRSKKKVGFSTLKPGGRIKPKPRKPSEFARIYGSKARVEWVKDQPCVVCGFVPSENAHIVTGGMGRKADFDTIIPLCRFDHRVLHRFGRRPCESLTGKTLEQLAAQTEAAWQDSLNNQNETRKLSA